MNVIVAKALELADEKQISISLSQKLRRKIIKQKLLFKEAFFIHYIAVS
jgi:hypothetical protein